jgi:hypothetical protein
MKQKPVTPELARDALAYIPANLPRDDWARIGAAIKSEFPDSVGFDLFDTWSQSSDGYDAKATAQTWKSIKASGGVTIGTLFYEAKARGFDLAEWHREHDEKSPSKPPSKSVKPTNGAPGNKPKPGNVNKPAPKPPTPAQRPKRRRFGGRPATRAKAPT